MAVQKVLRDPVKENSGLAQFANDYVVQPIASGIASGLAGGVDFASDLARKVKPYTQYLPGRTNPIVNALSFIPEGAGEQAIEAAGNVSGLGENYFKPQGMGGEIIKGVTQQAPGAIATGGGSIAANLLRSAAGNTAAQLAKKAGYGTIGQAVAQIGAEGLPGIYKALSPSKYFRKQAKDLFEGGLSQINPAIEGNGEPLIAVMDSAMNELGTMTDKKAANQVRDIFETIWNQFGQSGNVNIKNLYKTRFNLSESMNKLPDSARKIVDPVYQAINKTIDSSIALDPMALTNARNADAIYRNLHLANEAAEKAVPSFLQAINSTTGKFAKPARMLSKPMASIIKAVASGNVYLDSPILNKYFRNMVDAVIEKNIPAFVKSSERFQIEKGKNPKAALPKRGVYKVTR